jgi:hypothetical protein
MIVNQTQFKCASTSDVPQSQACMHVILKLRWMGLDDAADRLERAACSLAADHRGAVLAEPASAV